jgi:hypothetical protein
MIERRKSARTRSFIGCTIAYNRRWSSMSGLVRNLSADGTLVEFPDAVALPDVVDFIMEARNFSARAKVVWRGQNHIGVKFEETHRLTGDADVIPIGAARRIRDLHAQNDRLRRRITQLSESE